MSAALRARVAKGISKVAGQGKSLTEILPDYDHLNTQDKALARALLTGTLRQYFKLRAISEQLLKQPLKKKDQDVLSLILVGLYQLFETRIPDHAVLSETVQAAVKIKKPWAKGLINALLRKALRESKQLHAEVNKNPAVAAHMPEWIYQQLREDWPENHSQICQHSHQRAALTLRVNCRHNSRDQYLARLQKAGIAATTHALAEQALLLENSCDVTTLPGFQDGDFSVQDSAAQMAAQLLQPEPDHQILDACAAPGGKTAHILELTDNRAKVLALDNSAQRLQRLKENLLRLKLTAQSMVADAGDTAQWSQAYEGFDRILCDAPCSALGIIRRHPDIAILRRNTDIAALCVIQQQLLDALWPLLKPGGMMLYATCSILKAENSDQISRFLNRHPEARLELTIPEGLLTEHQIDEPCGWQIMPGQLQMDGFYYARLVKPG